MEKIIRWDFHRDDLAHCECDIVPENDGYFVEFTDYEQALKAKDKEFVEFLTQLKNRLLEQCRDARTAEELSYKISELEKRVK